MGPKGSIKMSGTHGVPILLRKFVVNYRSVYEMKFATVLTHLKL